MIAVQLQGGLGNQMFQYAFAAQLAARHSTRIVADASWFDQPRSGETPRSLDIMQLRVDCEVADPQAARQWRLLRSRFARRLPPFMLPMTLVSEHGSIDEAQIAAPDDVYLRGFWQSERYFNDVAKSLAQQFTPKAAPSDQDRKVLDLMAHGNAISLHVRRGDYVSLASAAAFHGTCSLAYYEKAIDHLLARRENCRFFVFSDDPRWTADNLDIPAETHFVAHNGSDGAVQDMRLMRHCRDHVIANSSFSWWGAWLAEQRDGDCIVIAPQQWFADRDAPDLVPSRWIKMQ